MGENAERQRGKIGDKVEKGKNRERVFFTLGDRSLHLRLIRENQAAARVRVLPYFLMTNHVHSEMAELFQRKSCRGAGVVREIAVSA